MNPTNASDYIPWYFQSLDFEKLWKDYPPPPTYFHTTAKMSRDELWSLQNKRFLETIKRGWEIDFFKLHWKAHGLSPKDIKSLDDLTKIPVYDVHDIRKSIERNPPFGDFMGISPEDGKIMPLVLQTSGGTTGLPRPMLYSPQDRETMAILGGRRFAMHGIVPGDMVLVTYSLGLGNGGMAPREALWRYTGSVPVMTGSGANTPTRRQIEIVKAWGVKVILGFPAYLRHMALVARDELGIDPKSLGIRLLGTHLGMENREQLEELWGAKAFDMYGTHESGMLGAECQHQSGMHVMEDAFVLEIADPETGKILHDGIKGTVLITTLYKYGAPQIRFNVNDISAFHTTPCSCGSTMKRLVRIFGRNDNMIKLRGVNVFPEAIGAVVVEDVRTNGEFFCFVDRVGEAQADRMEVWVEIPDESLDKSVIQLSLEQRMKEVLGVKVDIKLVNKGELDQYTLTSQSSKVKRLLDQRK
ncbi:MAG: phenylacetate--CoA ligase family protein [Burkholderiaceae bacterium]